MSDSGEFSTTKKSTGEFQINCNDDFDVTLAIVGSQTSFGSDDQNTLDKVVFPFSNKNGATALTGDSSGNKSSRPFSFAAIGTR
ncbi:hypothetical protein [Nisaea sp.]|uniref:hypothetical protein n=1 Tax=Nisaea sp. TaxID=2024842 RepID=UPI0032673FF7